MTCWDISYIWVENKLVRILVDLKTKPDYTVLHVKPGDILKYSNETMDFVIETKRCEHKVKQDYESETESRKKSISVDLFVWHGEGKCMVAILN